MANWLPKPVLKLDAQISGLPLKFWTGCGKIRGSLLSVMGMKRVMDRLCSY
jgi:hypothetical protein